MAGIGAAAAWALAHAPSALAGGMSNFDVFGYRDASGMTVITSEAGLEQAVAAGWLLSFGLLWDRIAMEATGASGAPGGHDHHLMKRAADEFPEETEDNAIDAGNVEIDATSGASQRASTEGGGLVQHRYQIDVGLARQIGHGDKPHRLGGKASVSYEDDYLSVTGIADASVELARRNATLSGYAGFGWDRVEPVIPPPGEADKWPGTQNRYLLGFGYSQVTGRRSVVSAGYGLSVQTGDLESPYRRSVVITTRFAENLPNLRVRHHGALSWSFTPWRNWGLHHREGIYYDSWNYHAWIPETGLCWQFAPAFLLTLRHRHVSQDAAEFWRHHYDGLDGYRSGDFRLDGLQQDMAAVELSWSRFFGYRTLEIRGYFSRFQQKSAVSGADPEGYTTGISTRWIW